MTIILYQGYYKPIKISVSFVVVYKSLTSIFFGRSPAGFDSSPGFGSSPGFDFAAGFGFVTVLNTVYLATFYNICHTIYCVLPIAKGPPSNDVLSCMGRYCRLGVRLDAECCYTWSLGESGCCLVHT